MVKLVLNGAFSDSEIYIEPGVFHQAARFCALRFRGRRVHIVSDTNVAPIYLDRLYTLFETEGFSVSSTVLSAGEEYKTLESVNKIYNDLVQNGLTRADLIVALGGGVIGDTAGFAASSFLRGINLCQIPTTLLAQVDSSVGGKTGVDLKTGKNLIGAFYQPHVVIIDPDMLATLPQQYKDAGMAEVIKYGFIADENILKTIETGNLENDLFGLICRSVEIKKEIVTQDERDTGLRMILNFGHTIGHAIEKAGNFTAFSHGQAVAMGMKAALKIGISLGITPPSLLPRLQAILNRFSLDLAIPYSASQITSALSSDKKLFSDTIRFILIKTPGEAVIHNMSLKSLCEIVYEII